MGLKFNIFPDDKTSAWSGQLDRAIDIPIRVSMSGQISLASIENAKVVLAHRHSNSGMPTGLPVFIEGATTSLS